MKYLASVAVVTLRDLKRNEDIRTQLNICKMTDIIE